MKIQKRVPLLFISMLASMLSVSLTARVSARGIYQEYDTYGGSQPSVAVLMQGLSHHIYPWDSNNQNGFLGETQLADGGSSEIPALYPQDGVQSNMPNQSSVSPTSVPAPDNESGIHTTADEPSSDSGTGSDQQAGSGSHTGQQNDFDNQSEQQDTSESGTDQQDSQNPLSDQPQEPEQYEFTEVSQDYFDDALFIGDSRAVGIKLYSGWDNITYYAESGMTVYNMFKRQITDREGNDTTIEEALKVHSFGKIYLEIGINEMGTGTVDSFMEAYENAVLHLQELQPDADIFLCGIMYVRKSKSDTDPIFNNPGIKERNERIAGLADQKTIFYLDINEVTSDESGNLNPDYTWDEVHLLGKYNVLWTEYLSSHGIMKEPDPIKHHD